MRARIQSVWNEAESRLREKWTVKSTARIANVSPFYFHRLVKDLYGGVPMEILQHMRMERARDYLSYTGYPLKSITELVGYATPFAFSAAFTRTVGISPKKIRQRIAAKA